MTEDPYGHWMGTPMDQAAIEEVLSRTAWGTLALAEDDVPYSIPMTFGFDGEDIYFGFIDDKPMNRKFEFLGEDQPARLLVTDVQAKFDWRSVAVTGPLQSLSRNSPHWDTLFDVLGENVWFESGYDRVRAVEEIHGWRLIPDEIVGRQVGGE